MTREERQAELLKHLWKLVGYWRALPDGQLKSEDKILDRLAGLAFSILTTIDGTNVELGGGYFLAWPDGNIRPTLDNDLSGDLHDRWYEFAQTTSNDAQE